MTYQFKVASILKLLMLKVFYKMKHVTFYGHQASKKFGNVATKVQKILMSLFITYCYLDEH